MARNLIAFILLSLLFVSSARSQAGSPEGGCICPNGTPATCGGSCPVCPTCPAICPNGVTVGQAVCNNATISCPNFPELTCVNNGGQGCAFTFDINFSNAATWVTVQNYIGSAPACMHTAGAACIAAANTSAGWTASASEPTVWHFFAHRFRDCMLAALTNNTVTGAQWANAAYPPLFFNANCSYLGMGSNPNPGLTNCGGIDFLGLASPISLILGGAVSDLESNYSLVNFPITPGRSHEFFTWKASAAAPLLVYDPEHRGIISRADQLFGNWTFGGQRVASLVTGAPNVEWRDGYEALGTLDANGDSKISGPELLPLALWFDSNRNAVSEPGEVRDLSSIGVKELYYKNGQRDRITGNIVSPVGYLRELPNGRNEIGASVDWYASGIRSFDDAMENFVGFTAAEPSVGMPSLTAPDVYAAAKSAADLTGIWSWSVNSAPAKGMPAGVYPKGDFFIQDGLEGGFLITSVQMMGGKAAGQEIIATSITPMKGTKSVDSGGATVLVFETIEPSKAKPVILKSTAVLQPDGRTIEGETTVSGKFRTGSNTALAYQWIATRRP